MQNTIVKIVNNPKTPEDEKKLGRLLISQSYTAGGKHMMKGELESYIERNKKYI